MKNVQRTLSELICLAGVGLFAGCTTYVERPYSPPPPPPAAYVPPAQEAPVPPPVEDGEVVVRSERDFYEPLAPYGQWVVVGSYGRCWRPVRVSTDWRPYCDGHWQSSDAGWCWASSEPWGWATYHYGRWAWDSRYGWVWVPQTEWAPAWVYWREGGGYVGWAPLPPAARISGGVVVEVAMGPRPFVFVEQRRFMEPVRPTTVIVNNTTIINKTVNITKIKVVNKTVINTGPRTDEIEKVSGRKVQSVSTRELRRTQESTVAERIREKKPARDDRGSKPVVTESRPRTATPPAPRTEAPPVRKTIEQGDQRQQYRPTAPEVDKQTHEEKKQEQQIEKQQKQIDRTEKQVEKKAPQELRDTRSRQEQPAVAPGQPKEPPAHKTIVPDEDSRRPARTPAVEPDKTSREDRKQEQKAIKQADDDRKQSDKKSPHDKGESKKERKDKDKDKGDETEQAPDGSQPGQRRGQ